MDKALCRQLDTAIHLCSRMVVRGCVRALFRSLEKLWEKLWLFEGPYGDAGKGPFTATDP